MYTVDPLQFGNIEITDLNNTSVGQTTEEGKYGDTTIDPLTLRQLAVAHNQVDSVVAFVVIHQEANAVDITRCTQEGADVFGSQSALDGTPDLTLKFRSHNISPSERLG